MGADTGADTGAGTATGAVTDTDADAPMAAATESHFRVVHRGSPGRRRPPRRLKCQRQDLVHRRDQRDLELVLHILGHVVEIALVLLRDEHMVDARSMRR